MFLTNYKKIKMIEKILTQAPVNNVLELLNRFVKQNGNILVTKKLTDNYFKILKNI